LRFCIHKSAKKENNQCNFISIHIDLFMKISKKNILNRTQNRTKRYKLIAEFG
jgi:hypothetical protein